MTTPTSSSPTHSTEPVSFGQIGFDAYGNHPGPYGKWATFDGRPMPSWNELGQNIPAGSGALTQERWDVAAQAIIAEYERRKAAARPKSPVYVGTINVDASQAMESLAELESRATSVCATLERANSLSEKLGSSEASTAATTTQETPESGPVASMTLTAWTPEAGAAVVRLAQGSVPAGVVEDEGRIDPFLMGLSEIAAATRDLAEAQRAIAACDDSDGPVAELIDDVTEALHTRVKALAQLPSDA
ncbi:hypothetical protein JQX13_50335 [Archangium violaceum]|uniref:hypothetical protein n=1 Tax=Archangium violaceum TaxID=83451 RepID=UPI00193C6C2C|nr:hypothetical protein [Archangium violaceum]QRK08067.1 hypothetical protein JQX13_50335 [Archangium violaceum]